MVCRFAGKGVQGTLSLKRLVLSVADHKPHALVGRLHQFSCVGHVYAALPPGTLSTLPGLLAKLPPLGSLLGFPQQGVFTSALNTHRALSKLEGK